MGVDYIREHYGMPWLKRGLAITVAGRPGKVVGFHGPWVRVRFEGVKRGTVVTNPCWETVYTTTDGDILGDFTTPQGRDAERERGGE